MADDVLPALPGWMHPHQHQCPVGSHPAARLCGSVAPGPWLGDASAMKPGCSSKVSPAPKAGTPQAPASPLCDLHHRACWLGAGNGAFVKLIKTTEAQRKGKLISHGNQLDLIQKNKQRVRSVSLAGCFSGKGITRRFPPKGMALCCCSLCNWGFRSGTKSHYHQISLSEKKS